MLAEPAEQEVNVFQITSERRQSVCTTFKNVWKSIPNKQNGISKSTSSINSHYDYVDPRCQWLSSVDAAFTTKFLFNQLALLTCFKLGQAFKEPTDRAKF